LTTKEFLHIADSIVRNIQLFVLELTNFLNAPDIKSIINETEIKVTGNIPETKPSKIFIQGQFSGLIGYIDVIPQEEENVPEYVSGANIPLPQPRIEPPRSVPSAPISRESTEPLIPQPPQFVISKVYIIRVFLKRNLPPEFTYIVRNFVLTYH